MAEQAHYDIDVFDGGVLLGKGGHEAMVGKLNERWRSGWRHAHSFEFQVGGGGIPSPAGGFLLFLWERREDGESSRSVLSTA